MNDNKEIKRVAFLWSSFGPYHVARIQGAVKSLEARNIQAFACRFSEKSDTYGWRPEIPDGIPVVTLGDREPQGLWDCSRIAIRWVLFLHKAQINLAFLPSYAPLPNFLCWLGAFILGVKRILMTESWGATGQAKGVASLIKHFCVRQSHGALVGGINQQEYMISMGMCAERICDGYDIVDVAYFRSQADYWRRSPDKVSGYIPERYFLSLGRLVKKKNLNILIKAHAIAKKMRNAEMIPLVIVGEGPEKEALINQAKNVGLKVGFPSENPNQQTDDLKCAEVLFYPFQQIERTPLFFTRCEAFILPSLWEEWGLVVNEAMACGAAILVSRQVGCARSLVEEGLNGLSFDPKNTEELAICMIRFLDDSKLSPELGRESARRIGTWSKERFGRGVIQLIDSVS